MLEPRPELFAAATAATGADGDSAAGTAGATEWPLRGEILVHVNRLRTELRSDTIPRQRAEPPRRARRSWPQPSPSGSDVFPAERLDRVIGRFDPQRLFSGMR